MTIELDKNQEAAMIKTCLLFDNKLQQKREIFFQKKLLADLFCKKYNSLDSAVAYLEKEMPSYAFDRQQVKTALNNLQSSNFVAFLEDGSVTLTKEATDNGNKSAEEQKDGYKQLVSDILRDVELNVPINNNRQQVRQNIQNCLEYYIQTSCYNLLALDDKVSTNDNDTLVHRASSNLPQDDRLVSQILLSIGSVIAQPTEAQRKILETMAQAQITMRLMGVDPMLQNFKRTLIASKVFVLDTDVVLYLITDNGERSRQYKSLLQQLLGCGCNIYIPEELFDEVYDHAEAAKKRYHFVSPVLNNDVGRWAESAINNVFIECLRYELQNHLKLLLTTKPGTDAYSKIVNDVKQQDYSFKPQIEYAMDLEKQNAEKDKYIEDLQKQLEKLKAEKKADKYKVRIAEKGKRKRNKK